MIKNCKFYTLKVLGIERKLPILESPSGTKIAGFNIVGDMELLKLSSEYLGQKLKDKNIKYDIVLTTELKGLPIAQEVARNLNCDYICLRKSKKCYMLNPIAIKSNSITSGDSQYYISQTEFEKLKNKNIIFVDDVYSTGETFKHILKFADNTNLKITACLTILREGIKNKDNVLEFNSNNIPVICCGFLPLP